MKRTRYFFLLIILSSNIVYASEPFDFISSLVNSLEICHIAEDRLKNSKTETTNEIDSMILLMKDVMVFNKDIEKARIPIEPYLQSENEIMQNCAKFYDVIFLSAIANNNEMISLIEQSMNTEISENQIGTFSRRLSEVQANAEDIWRQLPQATAMSTYSLVDRNRLKDGKMAYLTINSKERKLLIKQIEDSFGDKVKGGLQTGQFPIVASASLLWGFLNKEWISSNEK